MKVGAGLLRILLLALASLSLLVSACGPEAEDDPKMAKQGIEQSELIILSAPASGDDYYAELRDEITAFQIDFARRIIQAGDDVVILADQAASGEFTSAIGKEYVLIEGQLDIWARDFGSANPEAPILFGYTAEGQGGGRTGQREAQAVQEQLVLLLDKAGIKRREPDLLNDGGNFVEDGAGRAVISRKFLRDNRLSESTAREILQDGLGLSDIAFIEADEQGGLEHSDGVAAFLEPGLLVINSYPDDPDYARALRRDLALALPNVRIHEIAAPYDGSQVYDERFGSACGLYTNMLVTPHRIYLPQFGIAQDEQALATIRELTDKQVIPVPSGAICQMGGGVRCMSWQLRGEAAARLRNYIRVEQF